MYIVREDREVKLLTKYVEKVVQTITSNMSQIEYKWLTFDYLGQRLKSLDDLGCLDDLTFCD
jgi:phosphosulfolactate phosphohydrolase-like enzyme